MKTFKKAIGIQKLKRQNLVKPRSIPLTQRNTQTELYLLDNEKQRFLKELERIQKRQEFIENRLTTINAEIKNLVKIWQKDMQGFAEEADYDVYAQGQKQWKTKVMNY